MRVGLLHPGEMGAAIGAALRANGHEVLWASEGRSAATAARAAAFVDAGSVAELARRADAIVSVCPPHAAADVARSVAGFGGLYVDANAVSPARARELARAFARFADGGIVGGPPDPRLYLSGPEAEAAAALFAGSPVEPRVLSEEVGAASALKMTYAAWSKGSAALLLALREVARVEGVEEALVAEWGESVPELAKRHERALASARAKGWRWVGEMEEIAATFASAGQPGGFHAAAADVYRTYERPD